MGRNVEGLKEALKNVSGKTVSGNTKGEVFENFNLQYKDIILRLSIKDSAGEAVATPTAVLKKGEVVGSGDAITAEADDSYKVVMGVYNYSVSKEGYETESGVITLDRYDAEKAEALIEVVLKGPAVVTFEVSDDIGETVDTATIVLKKGEVVGSGDDVTAEGDGSYKCLTGKYNYSVSATNYATKTGTFEITKAQLEETVIQAVVLESDI